MPIKQALAGAVIGAATIGLSVVVALGSTSSKSGSFGFEPIAGSAYGQASADWTTPFVLPKGFTQKLVKDETTFDIYDGVDDLTDMNTVNETGPQKGRYLYRTHEVRTNGSVSVVDLKTGAAKILTQDIGYRRLDGIRWTPWGTLLFAEETTGGRLFEAMLDPNDPTKVVSVAVRPALGILAHEGIDVLPDGTTFVIDEFATGGIFKFVPDVPRDLSAGQLYALKTSNPNGTGTSQWIPLDRDKVQVDARAEATAKGASAYQRPEDVELIGKSLYVAITSTDRVIKINLRKNVVTNFVEAGVNLGIEDIANKVTGLNAPDNLAEGPDGRLWIVEDNDYSDIFVAGRDKNRDGVADKVSHFASMKEIGAEGSGIYFGTDPKTLYVNVQHPDKPLADGTWKITRK